MDSIGRDIFISHASGDAPRAAELAAALEGRGLSCWLAPRDIAPGAVYGQEIMDAIRSSQAMVVLLSQGAFQSDHVRREVERASALGRAVLPVRIEAVQPSGALEYFLGGSQYLDWLDGPPEDAAASIARLVGNRDTEGAAPVLPEGDQRPQWLVPSLLVLGGVVAGALMLGLLGLFGTEPLEGDSVGVGAPPVVTTTSTTPPPPTTTTSTSSTTTTSPTTTTTESPETTPAQNVVDPALLAAALEWPEQVDEEFADPAEGWFVGAQEDDNGTQTYGFAEDAYAIELSANEDGNYFSTIPVPGGSRLYVRTTVSQSESTEGSACGVALRFADDRFLLAGVSPSTGRGGAMYFEAGSGQFLVADEMPTNSDGPDSVALLLDGTAGYIIVNGEPAASFADERITEVVAAGVSAQFGSGHVCRFEDFTVRAP